MSRIRSTFLAHPWAILDEKLDALIAVVERFEAGAHLTAEEVAVILHQAGPAPQPSTGQGVAVIPVYGVLSARMNLLTETSGGTSYEQLASRVREAMADETVGSIIYDVDSPGGSVNGAGETASEILSYRGRKPMTAVANHTMASAAYWLMASADEIVVAPSSLVGSVGVIGVHENVAGALEKTGVAVEILKAGAHKGEGHPYGPLSEDARGHLMSMLATHYQAFVGHVAAARGMAVSAEDIETETACGGGRGYLGHEAVSRGLADRVGTLRDVVREARSGQVSARRARAGRARAEYQARLRRIAG